MSVEMKNEITMSKSSKGFTLAELLVAMAIISIFAVMAIPFSLNLYQGHQLNYSTNELLATLIKASDKAKTSKHIVVVNLNTQGQDDEYNWHYVPSANVALTTSQNIPSTLYMNPNGFFQKSIDDPAPLQEFEIRLCHSSGDKAASRTISVQTRLITSDGVIKNNCNFT